MHWLVLLVLATIAVAPATAQELKSEDDKALYALGYALADRLAPFALTQAELELVKAGLADAVLGRERKADPREQMARIQQLRTGARKTDSGLVVTTLKPGTGPSPKATDKVKVHYHGTLIDGSVFDSSVQRGQPATFPLNGVIKCWTEGVQLMKVGGKSRLVCPAELAYGERGAPPRIKPGATLIFEVELLEIVAE